MKTCLILIDNSAYLPLYHMEMGNLLKKKGVNVVYAFKDKRAMYTYNLNLDNEKYYVFSSFFKANYNNTTIGLQYEDINIWKLFFSDYDRHRVHYNFPKQKKGDYVEKYLKNLINFFDQIITENRISFCANEAIANSFAYACYEVAKRNKVNYFGYLGARIANKFELYSEEFGSVNRFKDSLEHTNLEDIPTALSNQIDEYLAKYKYADKVPSYHPPKVSLMAQSSIFKRYFTLEKLNQLKAAIKTAVSCRSEINYMYDSGGPLINLVCFFRRQLKRKYRVMFGDKYFDDVPKDEEYVLFPLHMKPEASTSICARYFCDDIAVLSNIAFSLPQGYKLYVKEHFVNYGNMSFSFYKELKKIPNVRLIHCDENIKPLIERSKALITLTGTMGFEALLMQKPVILLGEVFYKAHPCCITLKKFDELENILKDIELIQFDKDINKEFLYAYHKILYDGNINFVNYPSIDFDKFAVPFVNALLEFNEIK